MFHTNPVTGEVSVCHAEKGKCPYGASNHYQSMTQATRGGERIVQGNHTGSSTQKLSKKPASSFLQTQDKRTTIDSSVKELIRTIPFVDSNRVLQESRIPAINQNNLQVLSQAMQQLCNAPNQLENYRRCEHAYYMEMRTFQQYAPLYKQRVESLSAELNRTRESYAQWESHEVQPLQDAHKQDVESRVLDDNGQPSFRVPSNRNTTYTVEGTIQDTQGTYAVVRGNDMVRTSYRMVNLDTGEVRAQFSCYDKENTQNLSQSLRGSIGEHQEAFNKLVNNDVSLLGIPDEARTMMIPFINPQDGLRKWGLLY